MEVVNLYHKPLSFEIKGKSFYIKSHEIKEVDDSLGKKILRNYWINYVKIIDKNTKGRELIDNNQ